MQTSYTSRQPCLKIFWFKHSRAIYIYVYMPCHQRGNTANQRPYSNNITMSKFRKIALRMTIRQHCFKIRLSLLENICNTKRGSIYTSYFIQWITFCLNAISFNYRCVSIIWEILKRIQNFWFKLLILWVLNFYRRADVCGHTYTVTCCFSCRLLLCNSPGRSHTDSQEKQHRKYDASHFLPASKRAMHCSFNQYWG